MNFITAATQRLQNKLNAIIGKEVVAPVYGGRFPMSLRSDEGLTVQKLYILKKQAEQGMADPYLELADAMETSKDPQYRNLLSTRKQAVISVPLEIVSAGNDKNDEDAAELCRETLSGDWMASKTIDRLDGISKGYAVQEIIWDTDKNGKLVPVDLIWRDPRMFRFDQNDKTTLYLKRDYVNVPPLKRAPRPDYLLPQPGDELLSDYANNFLVSMPKSKSGIPINGGLAMAYLFYYLFKNGMVKDWVSFGEKYGTPPIFGKYPKNTKQETQDKFYSMLVNMGKDWVGVFEQGMDIELLEHVHKSANTNIYLDLIRYVDDAAAKLVLGQTLSSDTGQGRGSYALGAVHHAVRIDILKSDCRQDAQVINQSLVWKICDFNFTARNKYPYARYNVRENIDVQVMANSLQTLVTLGMEVPERWAHEYFSIPFKVKDEQTLTAPVAAPSGFGDQPGGLHPAKSNSGVQPVRKTAAAPDGKNSPSEAK